MRFLVVEDDEIVRGFLVAALGGDEHEVRTAVGIGEARRIVADRANGDALCLVVDVVLDGESGIDFAREMLDGHPSYRVLLISGFTDEVVMIEPHDAGRIGFLKKPFTRSELTAAVDRLWR